MDLGTYTEYAGRRAVRLERPVASSQLEVWTAISTPSELKTWFPSEVEFEPMPGQSIRFFGDPNMPDSTGMVLIYDAPEKFAFLWGGDEVHLMVEPGDGGRARLVLINVLTDPSTAARNAAGWYVCLEELVKHLSGERADGPHSEDALDWQEIYDAHVAAGVPAGAPVPGKPS